MQSLKQSDLERDFERDSTRNANVLSNPMTFVRAPAPRANAGAAFASAAEHEKASGDFECQVASQHARARLQAASGYRAWLSSDFEHKARLVQCFRVLLAWFSSFQSLNEVEDLLYNVYIYTIYPFKFKGPIR